MRCSTPVSYTHLDVYKRQFHKRSNRITSRRNQPTDSNRMEQESKTSKYNTKENTHTHTSSIYFFSGTPGIAQGRLKYWKREQFKFMNLYSGLHILLTILGETTMQELFALGACALFILSPPLPPLSHFFLRIHC